MPVGEDITRLLQLLKDGNREAVEPLLETYFRRLVGLARERLRGLPRGAADEEDVALSAFDSFCRRAEQGRFPRLEDRDDLWQVLGMILSRKACDLAEYERRKKRDCGQTRSLGENGPEPFSAEPDPAAAAEVADETARLLRLLPEKLMQDIAVRKLEGYTNKEIEKLVHSSHATVGLKLSLIRKIWKKELSG